MTTTMFADRLDFLMRLTNTQNSVLARALNFDASYISRIRSGRRGMPRHQPFVEPAANYFASRLTEPYQRKAVADAICRGREWPDDQDAAVELITMWLGGSDAGDDPVERFLEDVVALSERSGRTNIDDADGWQRQGAAASEASVLCYFGDEGKRQAAEAFLSELVTLGEPPELLLFSDERMDWLYMDEAFRRRWLTLLSRIAANGGHIRIVHTTGHSLDQMLESIHDWLPLYTTGAVEPWWYPRSHEGSHRRTLFVARGRVAIISSSVDDDTDGMLNILLRDATAVAAIEQEYDNYLALCHQLMSFDSMDDAVAASAWLRETARDLRASSNDVMLCDVGAGGYILLVREGVSATLLRKELPMTLVTVEEWSLAVLLWEYLLRSNDVVRGRDEVAMRLDQMATQLP